MMRPYARLAEYGGTTSHFNSSAIFKSVLSCTRINIENNVSMDKFTSNYCKVAVFKCPVHKIHKPTLSDVLGDNR